MVGWIKIDKNYLLFLLILILKITSKFCFFTEFILSSNFDLNSEMIRIFNSAGPYDALFSYLERVLLDSNYIFSFCRQFNVKKTVSV